MSLRRLEVSLRGIATQELSEHYLNHFAHVGKNRFRARPPRSLYDVEAELTIAQRHHHEPAPFERRIGQIVAPSAERHELIQVEVGTPPGAFYDVMDIEPPPHTAGPATPARSRQHPRSTRRPFGGAGSATAQGLRATGSYSTCGRLPNPRASP
jgi:hypothetical protein